MPRKKQSEDSSQSTHSEEKAILKEHPILTDSQISSLVKLFDSSEFLQRLSSLEFELQMKIIECEVKDKMIKKLEKQITTLKKKLEKVNNAK